MYKVLLLNDDYSSMEFVIKVLMQIFHHSFEKSTEIMLSVHEQGKVFVEFIPMKLQRLKWHMCEKWQ